MAACIYTRPTPSRQRTSPSLPPLCKPRTQELFPDTPHGRQLLELLAMDFLPLLISMLTLISDSVGNPEKLPASLMVCGGVLAAAALCLAIFKAPGGMFLSHGEAFFFLYYGALITVVIFGFAEAFAGLWLAGDLTSRQAIGKTILGISIFPLVIVAGLGGLEQLRGA